MQTMLSANLKKVAISQKRQLKCFADQLKDQQSFDLEYNRDSLPPVKTDRSNTQPLKLTGGDQITMSYLDGTLPADYGFDPLRLYCPYSQDDAKGEAFMSQPWLKYAEIMHCRWAMLGAAGILADDLLGRWGVIPSETSVLWWQTGVIPPFGSYNEYWADAYTIFFAQVVLMQFAELRRWNDYREPGSMSKQWFLGVQGMFKSTEDRTMVAYPGGPFFNILNMATKDEASTKTMRTKEINNGRLAMMSCLGYYGQALTTGKSPVDNIIDHVTDPWGNNVFTTIAHMLDP